MTRPESGNRLLAWRQLMRAGNVFTAISNVLAGYLIVTGRWPTAGWGLAGLAAASALLYTAGMVLNDAFDAELDRVERPDRPIPSGRISRRAAFAVGWLMLAGGVGAALYLSAAAANPAPAIVAGCLAIMVVLYDSGLKSTAAGPWAMGFCRVLNVLLGASGSPRIHQIGPVWLYALGVGVYTAVLTIIARTETGDSLQRALRVRKIVTLMILGFIPIDAIAATIAAGWPAGLAVLALMIPSRIAARRAPMT